MHSNIEIEAKVLLQKEQYEQVVSYLHLERYKKIKQTNHYIDSTTRVLRDNDFALRVREKDDFVLTLKTPLSEGLLEKNQTLSWREYDALEDESIFPAGITVIPVHMRGLQNCDTTFDRVFGDDTNHVKHFKYFNQYKDYNEIGEVLAGRDIGRKSDNQRIIDYNYGLAIHDVVYASKIYEMLSDQKVLSIDIIKETEKFWI